MQQTANMPSQLPAKAPDYSIEELFDLGAHFGHQASKSYPKMKPYIHTTQDGVEIFDLVQTAQHLQDVYNYLYWLGANNKELVVVGTKRAAREVIEKLAPSAGAHYITSRWLGGFLTNWNQVKKSQQRMLTLAKGLQSGGYQGYTKYEQVQLQKEHDRLERFFGGLKELKGVPAALLVVDPIKEKNAVTEANLTNVPVVALADSNARPSKLYKLVPTNDDSTKVIEFMLTSLLEGYKLGKQQKGA